MIIDTHVHIFPDKICPKTIEKLAHTNPEKVLTYYGDGSLHCAEENMKQWGIDLGVVLPIATNLKQQKNVNEFAAEIQRESPFFIGFGSLHPDEENYEAVIDDVIEKGLKGIKLHPDYQNFFIHEKRMYPIYQAISERNIPVVFHTGYDPVSPDLIHANPEMVRQVADDFPSLTIIAAHTGGLGFYDGDTAIYKDTPNLYLDTAIASYTYGNTPEVYRQLIDFYGAEKFIFATDNPWGDGRKDLEFLEKVGLSDREWELITHQNAERVLNLTVDR